MKQEKTFFLKTYLGIALIMFFLTTVSLLFLYFYLQKDQEEDVRQVIERLNVSFEKQVMDNLENVEQLTAMLKNSNAILKSDLSDFDNLAQLAVGKNPLITQIFLMDSTGYQYYKTSYEETLGDRSDRTYFQEAIKGASNFSEVIISRSTNRSIIVHAQPIYKDDVIIGVIGCSIDLKFLSDVGSNLFQSDESYGYIVDENGNVIGHPKEDYVMTMLNLKYLEPVQKALNGESGFGEYYFEGVRKLVFYKPFMNGKWGIFVQMPYSVAFANLNRLRWYFIAIALIVMVLGSALSYFMAKRIERPVQEILALISGIRRKHFDSKAYSIRKDEFGLIEMELLAMAHQVYEIQDKLESLVDERTKQLRQALVDLENAQALVILNEKMSALNRVVSSMSHEINTPIGNMVTTTSFLLQETEKLENQIVESSIRKSVLMDYIAQSKQNLSLIYSQIQKISKVIGLVKASALEPVTYEKRRVNLCAFTSEVEQFLKEVLVGTSHELYMTCEAKEVAFLYPEIIKEVLKALLQNAVQHGFEEGQMGRVEVHIKVEGQLVVIDFINDGRPIPEDILPYIFEPFSKKGMSSVGIGLGLTVVYALVTYFVGGHITCNNLTHGVHFKMEMPLDSDVTQNEINAID